MRIAIIGIINHDTIAMANGQELKDLGGILYNTAVLANMVDEKTTLFPVTRIGEDCHDMMRNILSEHPNVDLSGVAIAPEGTSRNTIRYDASMEKVERLTNHIESIPLEQIEPFLNHEAFLINFIIGDDISRETMRAIRTRSQGLIYLDVHNLCLGIDEQGYRFHRTQDRWHEWIEVVDVVQMNEVEASLLAGKEMDTDEDFLAFGKTILDLGPSIYIATRGRLGSVTVYREATEIKTYISSSVPIKEVVDTTGCGDAFAAGFLTDYLVTRDPISATRLASWAAGVNCTLAGLAEVERFRER
jgi:sugar/nucleoside kinase (ribokinase family)